MQKESIKLQMKSSTDHRSTIEKIPPRWYLEHILERFTPYNLPGNWTEERDRDEYAERALDKSTTHQFDTSNYLETNHDELLCSLDHGIKYLTQRIPSNWPPVSVSTLKEKVQWFTELLDRADSPWDRIRRFSWIFTWSLWLESELQRICTYHRDSPWLYQFCNIAYDLKAAQFELEESLSGEFPDYDDFVKKLQEDPSHYGGCSLCNSM